MNIDQLKSILAENKADLVSEFGVQQLGIFGSVAEGKSRQDSDIDLFYDLEDGKFLDLRSLEAFESKIRKLLHRKEVDIVNLRYMNPIVRFRAEKHFIYV